MNDEFVRRSFHFAMLRSRNFSRHSSSIVGPHKSNPLVVQKILAKIMLSEMKTSRLFLIFLLSSCDVVTWKAGRRRDASRWLLNFFFLNSNDYLDAVLSTDLGEQRCFKFLIRQFVSLNKTKIIRSTADRKRPAARGLRGARSSMRPATTQQTFQTHSRRPRQYNQGCKPSESLSVLSPILSEFPRSSNI